MPQHHPGTLAAHDNIDSKDIPRALTTYLLSINHDQFLRTTHHEFLVRAANGTIPKPIVAQWLANDLEYLKVYKGLSEQTLAIVQQLLPKAAISDSEDVQTRLIAWLEVAIQNSNREENVFHEVANIYEINIGITQATKNKGLRRYETLFKNFATSKQNPFIPWLEGTVTLWAMEKVYYEAWSWARRQDAQTSPKTYQKDQDGGAMRREFIPNWSNRDFMMFVEQLERILNEGVSTAVKGDNQLWMQVKTRTAAVWQAVLDAEETFWPDVNGTGDGRTASARELDGTTVNDANGAKLSTNVDPKQYGSVDSGHVPLQAAV